MDLGKRIGAEFIGTFWLVLGGCGSAVLAAKFPEVSRASFIVHARGHRYCPLQVSVGSG